MSVKSEPVMDAWLLNKYKDLNHEIGYMQGKETSCAIAGVNLLLTFAAGVCFGLIFDRYQIVRMVEAFGLVDETMKFKCYHCKRILPLEECVVCSVVGMSAGMICVCEGCVKVD
jgi:hypothetical protein